MQAEQIKNIYSVTKVAVGIFMISALLFVVFNLFGYVPKIFLTILVLLCFLNACENKHILESTIISNSSIYLVAVNLVICMSYVISIFFLLGRSFVNHL